MIISKYGLLDAVDIAAHVALRAREQVVYKIAYVVFREQENRVVFASERHTHACLKAYIFRLLNARN